MSKFVSFQASAKSQRGGELLQEWLTTDQTERTETFILLIRQR